MGLQTPKELDLRACLIIVESGNAILVCHKDYAQQIKEATKQIADAAEYL